MTPLLPSGPRVAIAHDYLTQRGGAERVVLSLCRAFPDAEVHTLFHEPEQTYPEFSEHRIRTSSLNRVETLRRDPRRALPMLAGASDRMRIDADLVIASSSGWAHAFPTGGARLVYCHSPARWLYLPADYLGTAGPLDPKRMALTALAPRLRRWDGLAAHRAAASGGYLANSTIVRERIQEAYGIQASTLFPPFHPAVADGERRPIPGLAGWAGPDGDEGGHYLVVSRLQPYKHVDRVIRAVGGIPGARLLVVGRGPERERLRALAPPGVRLVEDLDDAQLRWAYASARGLIAMSHEDFGLTPLEAGAHGIPTLALRAGGYLDTVVEGLNGHLIEGTTPAEIRAGLADLEATVWDPARIQAHAETFSEQRFIAEIRARAEALVPGAGTPR